MIINKKIIEKLNPCKDRFNNFLKYYPNFNNDLKSFLELENITYSDKVWVVTKLFSKEQNVKWSILCAESVLHIFEREFPNDDRPRKAIEVAKKVLNKELDASEAQSARSAAWSAARLAWSAESAAWSVESAVKSAAESAAESAAWSVESAVESAAWSVESEKQQETLNLKLMLDCLEDENG